MHRSLIDWFQRYESMSNDDGVSIDRNENWCFILLNLLR